MAPLWNSSTAWIVVGVPTLTMVPLNGPSAVTSRSVRAMPVKAVTRLIGPMRLIRSVM